MPAPCEDHGLRTKTYLFKRASKAQSPPGLFLISLSYLPPLRALLSDLRPHCPAGSSTGLASGPLASADPHFQSCTLFG